MNTTSTKENFNPSDISARLEYDGTGKDGNVFVCTHCLHEYKTNERILKLNYCSNCGVKFEDI